MIKAKAKFSWPLVQFDPKKKAVEQKPKNFESAFECRQKWDLNGDEVEICVVRYKAHKIRFLTTKKDAYKKGDVVHFEGIKMGVSAMFDRGKMVSVEMAEV